MTAKYISPELPGMIRNLYRDHLGEWSIQNMLNLAGDLIQELIDLRASTEEAKAQAWDEGVTESGLDLDYLQQLLGNNPYRSTP